MKEKLIYAGVALFIVICAIGYHDAHIKCNALNGVLVRTLFGTACVQGIAK